jgi:hypothetical protein
MPVGELDIRSRSSFVAIKPSVSEGKGSCGSASIPIAETNSLRPTAAAVYPKQCVMLPTTPGGQSGSRPWPCGIAWGDRPSLASALRAQFLP